MRTWRVLVTAWMMSMVMIVGVAVPTVAGALNVGPWASVDPTPGYLEVAV